MNRWQKSRKALWAAEKRLDRAFNEGYEAVEGFDDISKL
jgi:hypothetical protein